MPKAENNPADEAYARLAAHFLKDPKVTQSDKFGKGLRLDGKVFAMLVKGELVVKLSETDVASLIRGKKGKPFKHGKKAMKEWVAFPMAQSGDWLKLAKRAFVQTSV